MKTLVLCIQAFTCSLILFGGGFLQANDNAQGIAPGTSLTQWKVLGPVQAFIDGKPRTPDFAKRRSFDADLFGEDGGIANLDPQADDQATIRGRSFKWRAVTSSNGEIDLQQILGDHEWCIAYACATIESPEDERIMFGIGSDDAVRVWVNGKLVHDHWVSRSLSEANDLVPAQLQKGPNRVVLKVLNRKYGWGFSVRRMSQNEMEKKFVDAGLRGNLDDLKKIHEYGINLEATNKLQMTAYQAARLRGRQKAAAWLAEVGANTKRESFDSAAYVDAILEEESRPDEPGVAVLVSQDGRIVFSKGYGMANKKLNAPITPQTKFRIGSVTKQFAAASILKLQEEGKLSVQDTLDKFIPDYPRGDEVTLHHLLTHTSGIKSYTSKAGFMENVTKPITPKALIDSFKYDEFDFTPGEKWSYSNSGYFLLGHIIEQTSGLSFEAYLKQTFFEPLNMKDSGIHHADLDLDHEAEGYSISGNKFEDALNWDMSHAGAAGAIYSTVEDLQKWNEGVFNGAVLSNESLKAAFTKAETQADDNAMGYGYGWAMGQQRGLARIHHTGGLQGFSSYLGRFPEQNLTVAVLSNALPGSGDLEPSRLATVIAEGFLWNKMKASLHRDVDDKVDPKSYRELIGDYDYGSAVLTVTTEDNRLFAQLTGQQKMEIFPASPSLFFWKVVEAQVEFLRDADDKVVAVQHTQNGQSFRAARIKTRETIEVSDEDLESCVGVYDFGAVGKFVVTRKGNHLAAKLATQPSIDVYPESATKFFYKVIRADLEFVKNKEGKVEKVILRQGPAVLEGEKVE